MNENKRPIAVTILACMYIAVGGAGFAYHLRELLSRTAFGWEGILVEVTEFLAILFGAFMLRGQNWARWGALAWMLFHVIVSAFHTLREFAVHAVFCALIAWILFRPEASRYFRREQGKLRPETFSEAHPAKAWVQRPRPFCPPFFLEGVAA